MRRIVCTASALNDLELIWEFIAVDRHSPAAADRLIDDINFALRQIAREPSSGESVEHLRPKTRRVIVRRQYLVFYDVDDEGSLRVLRVLHGARLISADEFSG